MIRAAAWFCEKHCGALARYGPSWDKPAPALTAAFIDRPVKNYGRMTAEARYSLHAASLALKAAGWQEPGQQEIGLLCAGQDGFLQANLEYFRDYVAAGRSMGRGNLFIYTLPTSAAGEVAIALSLTGPTLYLQADRLPLDSLVRHAGRLIADQEADAMLALWTGPGAAVCLALGPRADAASWEDFTGFFSTAAPGPLQLAERLRAMVHKA